MCHDPVILVEGVRLIADRNVTMAPMGVDEFAGEVRTRREARRLSRPDLEQLSGVSAGTIEKLERPGVRPRPQRATAVDLARALDWDADEALSVLGEAPLSAEERELLPALVPPADLWADVQRAWPRLSPRQQEAFVVLLRAVAEPHGPAGVVSESVTVTQLTAGSAARAKRRQRRRSNGA